MLVRTQPPRHQAGSRRIGLAGGLKSLIELFPTFRNCCNPFEAKALRTRVRFPPAPPEPLAERTAFRTPRVVSSRKPVTACFSPVRRGVGLRVHLWEINPRSHSVPGVRQVYGGAEDDFIAGSNPVGGVGESPLY